MSETTVSLFFGIYNPLVFSAAPCIGVAIQTQRFASLPALCLWYIRVVQYLYLCIGFRYCWILSVTQFSPF